MQSFMVVMFNEKQCRIDELYAWLVQMRDEGRYSAPDMSCFTVQLDASKILMISYANMDLGRAIKDRGFKVRHQIWREL